MPERSETPRPCWRTHSWPTSQPRKQQRASPWTLQHGTSEPVENEGQRDELLTRVLVGATRQNGTKKRVGPVTAGHTAGPMAKEEINNFIDSPSYDPLSLLSFIHPLDKDIGKPLAFKAKIGTIFTSVCLDTGAGLNAISAKFLSQPGLKTTKKVQLDRPMFVQVGNSAKAALNEAVFLSLDVGKKSDGLWFLVVDKLPLNVLIGATSARRLGIEIRKDATYWDEIRLINSKGPETQTTDLLSMKS